MEKVAQAHARNRAEQGPVVSVTRYGNVMYSRGSVIPLFVEQMRTGQPLTVTDPDDDPVPDVAGGLRRAGRARLRSMPQPGDLFVRKAPACTVRDLALALAGLFGVDDPEIRVLGTRHGEKLYETLLSREELQKARRPGRLLPGAAGRPLAGVRAVLRRGRVDDRARRLHLAQHRAARRRPAVRELLRTLPPLRRELEAAGRPVGRRLMRVARHRGHGFLGWHTWVPPARAARRSTPCRSAAPRPATRTSSPGWSTADRRRCCTSPASTVPTRTRSCVAATSPRRDSLARAVRSAGRPLRVVYANSVQAGEDSPYGEGKAAADGSSGGADRDAAARSSTCVLPNLFGEHGGPTTTRSSPRSATRSHGRGADGDRRPRGPAAARQDAAAVLIDGDVRRRRTSCWSPRACRTRSRRCSTCCGVPRGLPPWGDPRAHRSLPGRPVQHLPVPRLPRSTTRFRSSVTVRRAGRALRDRARPRWRRPGLRLHDRPGPHAGRPLPPAQDRALRRGQGRGRDRAAHDCSTTRSSGSRLGRRARVVDMPTMWAHNITNTGEDDW